VTIVLALPTAEPLQWGLDPARLRCPATIFVPAGDADPLAGRALPPHVRLRALSRAAHPESIAGRVRLLARAADSGSDDELWVWVDAMYAASLLSLEILYSELFAGQVRADRRECPLIYGHHGYAGNPVVVAMTRRELAEAAVADDQTLADMFDPYPPMPAMEGVMPVDLVHLAHRPTVHFQRGRTDPVVHVIGDSHSLFCFTPRASIGCRSDILVDVRELGPVRVPFRWQFTHHRGAITMYRIGRDAGELGAASLAEIDVRDGDALVFVFGEIDVRCHVMQQHARQGRSVEEIVERLADAYIGRLAEVAARVPHSLIGVSGVIPPFDPPNYGPANPPIVGTLAERVVVARLLNETLERRAAAAGFLYFDAMNELAGPDGSLPVDRSDLFCHAAYDWAHVSTEALYGRLATVGMRTRYTLPCSS